MNAFETNKFLDKINRAPRLERNTTACARMGLLNA